MNNQNNTLTFDEIAKLPIKTLTNTIEQPFWWKTNKFEQRFKHENARKGSRFVDGNNGDKWRVIATDTNHAQLLIENLTQGGITIVIL